MATMMHFGPEWMRAKPTVGRGQPAPSSSPPLPLTTIATSNSSTPGGSNSTVLPSSISSYSSLVTATPAASEPDADVAHPFKYSKAELLRIYKEIGWKNTLPIEVEKWEGVVIEEALEPFGVKEMTDIERKLFTSSINSELRRRQSSDYLIQADRNNVHISGGSNGGAKEGFSTSVGRRRRGDSTGADLPALNLNRKQSWTSTQGAMSSPSLASPRTRTGGPSHGAGFDGVLNAGDGWSGLKRRLSAVGPLASRDAEAAAKKEPEIKEEEEEKSTFLSGKNDDKALDVKCITGITEIAISHVVDEGSKAINDLSLNTDVPRFFNKGILATNGEENESWDYSMNYSTVLWSYLDPTGNVQGPFPADTMQSWFDQQYFTDDLRMRRMDIDGEWMTVGELKRRALGDKIYLSPLSDIPIQPPGLTRRPKDPSFNSDLHGTVQNSPVFESPFQPIPRYSSRSSTMDSYLLAGQSDASHSPVNNVGNLGFGRSPMSDEVVRTTSRATSNEFPPDPQYTALASANSYHQDTDNSFVMKRPFGDMSAGAGTTSRSYRHDRPPVIDKPGFSNNTIHHVPWQSISATDVLYSDLSSQALDPTLYSPVGNANIGSDASFGGLSQYNLRTRSFTITRAPSSLDGSANGGSQSSGILGAAASISFGAIGSSATFPNHSHTSNRETFTSNAAYESELNHDTMQSPSLAFGAPQQQQSSLSQLQSPSDSLTGQQQPLRPQTQLPYRNVSLPSPWGVPQPQTSARIRPFDAPHPTIKNTFDARTSSPQSWLRDPGIKTGTMRTDGWGDIVDESHSLTFNHVKQHDQLTQDFVDVSPSDVIKSTKSFFQPTEELVTAIKPSQSIQSSSSQVMTTEKEPVLPNANFRQSTLTSQQLESLSQISPTTNTIPASSSTQTVLQSKSAWSIEDEDKKDKKVKSLGVLGLREFQEAEKKKQEARKVAEREKEKLARAAITAASPTTPETQTIVATWGLPTSQAGSRAGNNAVPKDTNDVSLSPLAVNTAPWTNATKPVAVKKTMKEIQEEEEERRKLQAVGQRETIASAAKRAIADTATKTVAVSSVSTVGGPWTTIGAGGKPQSSSVRPSPAAQTPSLAPQVSLASVRSIIGATSARPPTAPQASKVPVPTFKSHLQADDEPKAPSVEFLRWLRDSLKGLNSTVQFEEIAQMLLSFPLDPDPSSVELISETVYGASTTLDGRRFAADFVARRKADAASQKSCAGTESNSNDKSVSLADVVKAQPKPAAQSDWAYKVVKKKGKGGRSQAIAGP